MATLNMTAAASEINLSPPAVSLQIKRLSEELGAELFIRMGPKVVPTLAAKRLQEHLDPLMNVLQAIREEFPPEIENDRQPFILGGGNDNLGLSFAKTDPRFAKKFPNNDIQVRVGTTESS